MLTMPHEPFEPAEVIRRFNDVEACRYVKGAP